MKLSVALAAYNGEKYIAEQLRSILDQLGADDEVVVSDDNPSGGTRDAVMALSDARVRYVEGPGQGVIKNFENAIARTTGDIIFLSDQDDVWLPGKVEAVVSAMENGAKVVLHNAQVTDENLVPTGDTMFALRNSRPGYTKNVIRNSYMGCCMAFEKSLKDKILPFPDNLPMHDQWIGLIAERSGDKVQFIETPYLLYRRNDASLTGQATTFSQKLSWRRAILTETRKRCL